MRDIDTYKKKAFLPGVRSNKSRELSLKRRREIDDEFLEERSHKRKRLLPTNINVALSQQRKEENESVSTNFAPFVVNSDDVKARVRYHIKRCNKINHSNTERKHITETPAISVSELEKMCERAMKEREIELRKEYENALSCRMLELYESFVKFNNDMMTRGPWAEVSSYVS